MSSKKIDIDKKYLQYLKRELGKNCEAKGKKIFDNSTLESNVLNILAKQGCYK